MTIKCLGALLELVAWRGVQGFDSTRPGMWRDNGIAAGTDDHGVSGGQRHALAVYRSDLNELIPNDLAPKPLTMSTPAPSTMGTRWAPSFHPAV